MSNLNADYNMLKKTIIDYLLRLKNAETPTDIKQQFLDSYRRFNAKMKLMTELITKIEQYKLEIIDYYCEDPKTFSFDDFFKIFHDFCSNLIRAREVLAFLK